jgi:Na+/H+ antiporter NhaD/arsenite permease-like protein
MGEEHAPLYIKFLREIALAAIILLSWFTTRKQIRKDNHFTWEPISEVAILFVGIFITMTPAMLYLRANAELLGLTEPWQFFYSTGALSSFLDNAPTAVAFYEVAMGLPTAEGVDLVAGIPAILLRAISLGAVFFGAMTYIGNGPNFMVKAIAEQEGIKMPSFFGYILKFTLVVLLPVYIIVQLIFL